MSKPHYRVILILLTVACAVCALVTTPIALLTATWAFDTPESYGEVWAWVGFFVILSIPFWFIIGAHRLGGLCTCTVGRERLWSSALRRSVLP